MLQYTHIAVTFRLLFAARSRGCYIYRPYDEHDETWADDNCTGKLGTGRFNVSRQGRTFSTAAHHNPLVFRPAMQRHKNHGPRWWRRDIDNEILFRERRAEFIWSNWLWEYRSVLSGCQGVCWSLRLSACVSLMPFPWSSSVPADEQRQCQGNVAQTTMDNRCSMTDEMLGPCYLWITITIRGNAVFHKQCYC